MRWHLAIGIDFLGPICVPIDRRIFPLPLAKLWHINKDVNKLFIKRLKRGRNFTKIQAKNTHQIKHLTWLFVKKTTSFLQRISIMTRTIETTTPPSRIIKTPAKLCTSRLCVLPVFFCEGFGHWLRSSHQLRRVFSIKFFSRNYKKKKIKPRQFSRNVGNSDEEFDFSRAPCGLKDKLHHTC